MKIASLMGMAILSFAVMIGVAHAEEKPYVSLEYLLLNPNIPDDDWDNAAILGRLGKMVSPNMAVEGYAAFGIQSEKFSDACDYEEVSTDYIVGVQVKGIAELSPKFSLNGSVGLNMIQASVTIGGFASCYGVAFEENYEDTELGLAYGVGAEYHLSETSSIVANFHIFYDDEYSGVELQIPGVSVGYKWSMK